MYEEAYTALLALVAPLLGGTAADCPPADDALLYALAKKHDITNLLYLAKKDDPSLDPQVRTALERRLYASVRQQVLQGREAQKLFAALRKQGIRFLPMKGIVLRPLYPSPEMRTSCDVDLLYDRDQREALAPLMEEKGYSLVLSDINHEEYSKPPCVTVETHRSLCMHLPTIDRYYQDIWDRLIPVQGSEYAMRDEDFYIYQTVHAMKHFIEGGTGIRTVMDYFVFLQKKPALDRAYLEAELRRIELWDFHLAMEQLARTWFGGEPLPDALEPVAAYMLGSGVYGTAVQMVANRAARQEQGRIGYLWHRAFPPFSVMAEKYPTLKRHPARLPLYWFRRLFGALFHGRRTVKSELAATAGQSPEECARLSRVMEQAGLQHYR